ncbi:hypothetical protein [Streptacidiphilus melanogenes]|uniref:hypothetical protein n=1 Tax=Streptacidiphilus melanogenes TaxID=411235 RepID=UPI0005AA807E|nr:hypothetical protein [Streptacidiphilus melanogenes]
MRPPPHGRVWLPLGATAAVLAVGAGLWTHQDTQPVHDTAAHASQTPAPTKPAPVPTQTASASPSASASASRSSGSGTVQHQAVRQQSTQRTSAESQAAIRAKAKKLTGDIGKGTLTIRPPRTPSAPPTIINVGD